MPVPERGFQITSMPYIPALNSWLDHLDECLRCTEAYLRLGEGEAIPVTDFCDSGTGLFIAFMKAIDHQHHLSHQN